MKSYFCQAVLANADLPAAPPTFDAIAAQVEQIPGVQFRALFARLPQTTPSGDAAIAAVWQLVQQAKGGQQQVLAAMPQAVQDAIQAQDVAALQSALAALPDDEAQAIITQLRQAGIVR
jgi:cytochrome c556